jgi:hypothetical protein
MAEIAKCYSAFGKNPADEQRAYFCKYHTEYFAFLKRHILKIAVIHFDIRKIAVDKCTVAEQGTGKSACSEITFLKCAM